MPDEVAALGVVDGRLHVPYCAACARWVLPAESSCPRCEATLGTRAVSGTGTVFTYTVNHHAFDPALPTPYVIAIIELAEQRDLRIAANIIDCEPDSVGIGMEVAARLETPETPWAPVFGPRG